MSKFIAIKEASNFLGVSTQTLRRWERQGKLIPAKRTPGGQRRYNVDQLVPSQHENSKRNEIPTLAYARVSSYDPDCTLLMGQIRVLFL